MFNLDPNACVKLQSGMELGFEVRGIVLLLAACGGFSFWLYRLASKSFLLLLLFLCVCKACFLLAKIKLFYLNFFKGLSCLFLVKLVDYFQFFFLALLLPIGNFCCWANILGLYIYIYILDFRSIIFFFLWPLK